MERSLSAAVRSRDAAEDHPAAPSQPSSGARAAGVMYCADHGGEHSAGGNDPCHRLGRRCGGQETTMAERTTAVRPTEARTLWRLGLADRADDAGDPLHGLRLGDASRASTASRRLSHQPVRPRGPHQRHPRARGGRSRPHARHHDPARAERPQPQGTLLKEYEEVLGEPSTP